MFIILSEAKQVESNSGWYLWCKQKTMRKQKFKNLSSPFIHTQYVQKTGCKTLHSVHDFCMWLWDEINDRREKKRTGLFYHNSLGLFFFFKVFPIVYFGLLFQSNTRGFLFKGHRDPPSSLQPLQFFWFHCEALCSGACKVQMPSAKTFEEQHWLWISLYSCIQKYVFVNYSFFSIWGFSAVAL